MKKIRDGLYDEYIFIEDDELEVLDSEYVQRLRKIRQLGLSSLVYPTATHTRFSHSIGVLNLSSKMAESLDLSDVERKSVRLAGLLHDVGHGPFSHASEYAFKKTHEEKSCEIVEELEDKGVLPVSAHKINQYIRGKRNPSIIAGDIDTDRMDYLKRDSHFTGIPHGKIDTDTIIKSVTTKDDEIVFKRRSVEAIEQLLVSRKNMMGSVYCHPTVQIAENMLQKAVLNLDIGVDELWRMDDYQLHTTLLNSTGVSRELYERVDKRNLYKTAYELRHRHLQNGQDIPKIDKQKLKTKILENTQLNDHELIVQSNSPSYTLLDITIKTKDGYYSFDEVSNTTELLNKPSGNDLVLSVYTKPAFRKKVKDLVQDIVKIK